MAISRSHHQQQRALGKIRPGSLLNGAVSILTSPIANVREEWLEEQACREQFSRRKFARPTAIDKSKLTEIGLVSSNCADTPLTWSMSDFNAFI